MNVISRRDSGREVQKSGGGWSPTARAKRKEAKESSDGSRIKKEKQKHTKSE
jgi:hypothetical protein